MALDLNDLNDLGNFFTNYDEQFTVAKVTKTATDLPEGSYTGKLTKLEFDKLQDGSKYLLRFEVEVLTAKEPANADQIGNLTSKVIWINPASNQLNDDGQLQWVADIKQNLYNVGLVIDNSKLSQLAHPTNSPLQSAIGNVVKFQVKHNYSTKTDKTYVNLYFQGVVMKALSASVNSNDTNNNLTIVSEDNIPF
jgi:hypothetical protein